MTAIERQSAPVVYALNTDINTAEAVGVKDVAGARVCIPAGSTITQITVHETPKDEVLPGENPILAENYQANDSKGQVILTVAAGNSYTIPADLFASRFLKLVADNAGEVVILLKG